MDSETPTPIDHDCAIRLRIGLARDDDATWNEQRALIKRTGAVFEDGSWYLWIEGSQLTTERTATLWQAVAKYGTSVRIDAVKPNSAH